MRKLTAVIAVAAGLALSHVVWAESTSPSNSINMNEKTTASNSTTAKTDSVKPAASKPTAPAKTYAKPSSKGPKATKTVKPKPAAANPAASSSR